MLTFLADEQTLSQCSGVEIQYPIRLFDLSSFGIKGQQFISDILPSFYQLEYDLYTVKHEQQQLLLHRFSDKKDQITAFFNDYWTEKVDLESVKAMLSELTSEEYYDLQSIRPYRRRSMAQFELLLLVQKQQWLISRRSLSTFTQKTGDYRTQPRKFPEMSDLVTNHGAFRKLLIYLARLVKNIRPETQNLQIICHQVGLVALPKSCADNAPEGIHQDGADYIVSALVIERRNIQGGTSIIYGCDKRTVYFTTTLQPGQGIFQADHGSDLWHDVTPIVFDPNSSGSEGVRNILGFDIQVNC